MVREILFRGKREGDWFYGDLLTGADTAQIWYTEGGYGRVNVLVDPSTLGQYTGLTDKNGKRIFEGDIVKNVEIGKIGRVSYIPEHCGFMIYCKSDNHYYWLYDNDLTKIEVIGNIHDNPELLGG